MFPLDTVKEEVKVLRMMQPDIHAATVSGHNDVIDWSSSDEEDQAISMDLPSGYQPKASRPKGQAVKVAAVDPNDVGEDGLIKLFLTSKRKSHNKMTVALAAATPKMKATAMPKQAASSSDQATASAAGSSKTQPGEIRGPDISPKAKAAPKAAEKPGDPWPNYGAEASMDQVLGDQDPSDPEFRQESLPEQEDLVPCPWPRP